MDELSHEALFFLELLLAVVKLRCGCIFGILHQRLDELQQAVDQFGVSDLDRYRCVHDGPDQANRNRFAVGPLEELQQILEALGFGLQDAQHERGDDGLDELHKQLRGFVVDRSSDALFQKVGAECHHGVGILDLILRCLGALHGESDEADMQTQDIASGHVGLRCNHTLDVLIEDGEDIFFPVRDLTQATHAVGRLVGGQAIHEVAHDALDVDRILQSLASRQELLQSRKVEFTGEHLNDDLHEVVLSDGVFAADHLLQDSRENGRLVIVNSDSL
mmetsp:Transcript_2546/g.3876  ORF Transcript_2546/g.3876 Transcript_2546/m.3876 type:complete len:276 (+) Transcript_2546:957-1784(+)